MNPETILLLAGILFILIAVVGGGFTIREITIPRVPKWARIVSIFLALVFIGPFFYRNVKTPPPPPPGEPQIIYSDYDLDTSIHNIQFRQLIAKCIHNPPRVNDSITIEFIIQNVSNKTITFLETFVAARNPFQENKDFGYSNQGKTFQPQEIIKTKVHIKVDTPGTWQFGPCYALDVPVVVEEDNLCPSEWRRFPIDVVQ